MPPRKSNVSLASAQTEEGTPTKDGGGGREGINIEDLSLPRTMVQRLAKGVLPPNTQIHKDAILAMQKAATVFVNYLASASSDILPPHPPRRTVPPGAVSDALSALDLDAFVPRVETELARFMELHAGKRNEYRRKVREAGKGDEGVGAGGMGRGGRGKRVRREVVEKFGGGEREREIIGEGMEVEPDVGDEVGEEEEEEEEEERGEGEGEEEEEEEEDEDEYPDEGRRLSSVEREEAMMRGEGKGVGEGGSSMGEGSGSGSEDSGGE